MSTKHTQKYIKSCPYRPNTKPIIRLDPVHWVDIKVS